MCLIVYLEGDNSFVLDRDLQASIARNKDGAGVMYPNPETGRLEVFKLLDKNPQEVFAFLREHDKRSGNMEVPIAMHMRLATVGDVQENNVHPFRLLDKDDGDLIDLYLMHNGTIPGYRSSSSKDSPSDTQQYINEYLVPLLKEHPELYKQPSFLRLVEKTIGSSKFLMMDSEGGTFFANKQEGVTFQNAWLSNTYSLSSETINIIRPPVAHPQRLTSNYGYTPYYDNYFPNPYAADAPIPTKKGNTEAPKVEAKEEEAVQPVPLDEKEEETWDTKTLQSYAGQEPLDVSELEGVFEDMSPKDISDFCICYPEQAAEFIKYQLEPNSTFLFQFITDENNVDLSRRQLDYFLKKTG